MKSYVPTAMQNELIAGSEGSNPSVPTRGVCQSLPAERETVTCSGSLEAKRVVATHVTAVRIRPVTLADSTTGQCAGLIHLRSGFKSLSAYERVTARRTEVPSTQPSMPE